LAGSRRQGLDAVLTDFDRTLVWLFEDRCRQREACQDLLAIGADWGVPAPPGPDPVASDPYDLWADADRWVAASASARDAESLNDTIAACLATHELEAAASARLLGGVGMTLWRLRGWRIPVAVVSNNATDAVWQALKANRVEGLVTAVLGHSRARRSELTAAGARCVVAGFADLEALLGDAASSSPPLPAAPQA
jgi:phosphoglycolate phosphatase-like HAD superfamily hydrolase